MNHLHLWINTRESEDVSDKINNDSAVLDNNYIKSEKSDFLELTKETIEKYTNQLVNKEISVTDKGFKEISSRLFEDILAIYLSNEMLYDSYFKIVEKLNIFYKKIYMETKSPVACLYQGKFSVVYELFLRRKTKTLYEKMLCSNKQIEKIIWDAMMHGACNLKGDIDKQTKKDLNWLENNNYINILSISGYIIRLSNNFKFMISLDRDKYLKSYYLLFHQLEDDLIIYENQSDVSRKYLIMGDFLEDNYE